VRWNRLDLYFLNLRKILTLPQFPLVHGNIEEVLKSQKLVFLKDLLRNASSMVPEIKGK